MKVPFIRFVPGRNAYDDKDDKHYGWAIHATANTASDEGEASYAQRRTDGTSSHFYHDWDSVTQSLDTDAKAGHAGSSHGNENGLASEFTGLNSYTREQWLKRIDWEDTGRVIAYVLDNDPDFVGFQVRRASVAEMKANPKVQAFYGHDDMRRAWGGTTHTDPGPNFPWDKLFEVVNKYRGGADMPLDQNDLNAVRKAVALGIYDIVHVAANHVDFNGIKYTGTGSLGQAVEQNLGKIASAPAVAAIKALALQPVSAEEVALALASNQDFINAVASIAGDVSSEKMQEAVKTVLLNGVADDNAG